MIPNTRIKFNCNINQIVNINRNISLLSQDHRIIIMGITDTGKHTEPRMRIAACTAILLFLLVSVSSSAHPVSQMMPSAGATRATGATVRTEGIDPREGLVCVPDQEMMYAMLKDIFNSLLVKFNYTPAEAVNRVKEIENEFRAHRKDGQFCISENSLYHDLLASKVAKEVSSDAQPSVSERAATIPSHICVADEKKMEQSLEQIFTSLLNMDVPASEAAKKVKLMAEEFRANHKDGQFCISKITLNNELPVSRAAKKSTESQVNETSRFQLDTAQRDYLPSDWPEECTPPEETQFTCFFWPPTMTYGPCDCLNYYYFSEDLYYDCNMIYYNHGYCSLIFIPC